MSGRGTVAEALDAAWFGEALAPENRDRLLELAELRSFPRGAELTKEGSPASELGIVIAGRVALRIFVPERGPVTILTVEPGDIFEWSAIVPPYRATSTATAVEPVVALRFDGDAIRGALARDPELAAAIYPLVLEAVARRLAATRMQLLDLFARHEVEPW